MKLSKEQARRISESLNYDRDGLVAAIAQDAETLEVLMIAFMNREAVERTLTTGLAHYFSRERKAIWLKGERSGHYQEIVDVRVDCDSNALLLKVKQLVGACHLGYRTCFFRKVEKGALKLVEERIFEPREVYSE